MEGRRASEWKRSNDSSLKKAKVDTDINIIQRLVKSMLFSCLCVMSTILGGKRRKKTFRSTRDFVRFSWKQTRCCVSILSFALTKNNRCSTTVETCQRSREREREREVMTDRCDMRACPARTNPVITRLTDFSRRLLVKETPVLELQNCRFPPRMGRLAS